MARAAVVDDVVEMLHAPGQSSAVQLYGPPGVGKSAVAIEVGHRLRAARRLRVQSRAYDVVWISAQSAHLTREGRIDAASVAGRLSDVIRTIAATLNRADILREVPEGQVPLLHAELARRSVLVICDALDEIPDKRVRSFLLNLPHPTIVLATSRTHLSFGRSLEVRPLARAEAAMLAAELDPDLFGKLPETDRQQLLETTAGLPLALAWSLAILSTGAPAGDVLTRLGEAGDDLLSFCFDDLWRSLPWNTANALAALAMYPHGATAETVALVSGEREQQALSHLRELRYRALVEIEGDRAFLLPMTRAYTVGQHDDRSELGGIRRARWAEEIAVAAAAALHLPTWAQVFEQLELRRGDIEDMLSWSEDNTNSVAARRAATVWAQVAYFLFSKGYWDLLLRHGRWANESLLEQGLLEEYVESLLTWVARVFLLRGEHEHRAACFSQVERVLSGDIVEAALVKAMVDFNRASDRMESEREISLCVRELTQAAVEFRRAGRYRLEAMAFNRLGNMLFANHGDDDEAEAAYANAIVIAGQFEEQAWGREMMALGRGNIGIISNRRGDHRRALRLLRQAEPDVTQAFDAATLTMELAIAEYHLGDHRAAMRHGRLAQEKADRLRTKTPVAESDTSFEEEILPRLQQRALRRSVRLRRREE